MSINEYSQTRIKRKRRLKSRELEVSHVREEETQRARMLQMAVLNYCQNIPQSTETS
jgi:hypothetical protein